MSKDNNTYRINTPQSQYSKSLNVLTIRKAKLKQVELLEVTLEIQNDHRPFQPLALSLLQNAFQLILTCNQILIMVWGWKVGRDPRTNTNKTKTP